MTITDAPPSLLDAEATRPGDLRSLARLTGVIGVAATALGIAALATLTTGPHVGASSDEVVRSLRDHHLVGLGSAVLGASASVLGVVFVVGLRQLLDRTRAVDRFRGDVAMIGTVLLFTIVLVGSGLSLATAVQSALPGGVDPALAATVSTALLVLINFSAVPTLVICAALFGVLRRDPSFPAGLAWMAIVVAVAHTGAAVSYASGGVLAVDGPFAIAAPLAWYVWMAALAVSLLRGRGGRRP